jgi:hypothetical protein
MIASNYKSSAAVRQSKRQMYEYKIKEVNLQLMKLVALRLEYKKGIEQLGKEIVDVPPFLTPIAPRPEVVRRLVEPDKRTAMTKVGRPRNYRGVKSLYEGQHDEHVRRYKKIMYMRQYMERRNHPERFEPKPEPKVEEDSWYERF